MINQKYVESDFENLQLSKCDESLVHEFLESINNDSLGRKVALALNQRDQGHFDKAMLNISEANRDQVLAIREIQSIFDKLAGRGKTEVIFEKYRQIFPFQIGLINGGEVLYLLAQIKFEIEELPKIISDLHLNEDRASSLNEELAFFEERMKGKVSEKELDEIRKNITSLVGNIVSIKTNILKNLINFMEKITVPIASPDDKLRLVRNFYVIITSSIETLDADFVEI